MRASPSLLRCNVRSCAKPSWHASFSTRMRNGRNKWAETLNLIRGPRKFALGYAKSRKQATPESRFHLIRGKRRKHPRRRKEIHRPSAHEKLTPFVELESAIRTAETCENPALRGVRVSGNNGKQAYLFSATASPMILAATGQATVNPKKGPKSCIAASPVTYRFRRFV